MSVPNQPDRAALAAPFRGLAQTPIVGSDPNQVFQLPVPGATRARIMEQLQPGTGGYSNQFADLLEKQLALPPVQKQEGEAGIFGIPVLGDILDVLDTPRAMVVSTVQEIGDLFGDGDASLTDWWDQSMRNMSAGEVLRNWGVDLPGPLDFIVGLGLDIALDPLTYLAGAGAALRLLRAGPEVATALSRAADVAEAAGDVAAVQRFRAAEQAVSTTNVTAAAGRHAQALRDIGLDTRIGFRVPGTGQLGRRIIERPFSSMSPKFAEWLAQRRIAETPQFLLDSARRGRTKFDLVNPNNQQLVVQRLTGTGGISAQRQVVGEVADVVSRSPVVVRLPAALGGDAGAKALGALAGAVGGGWNAVARSSFVGALGRNLDTQWSLNRGLKDPNPEIRSQARRVRTYGLRSGVIASRWEKQTLDELQSIVSRADELGLTAEEFDVLMIRAADTPEEMLAADPLTAKFASSADGEATELSQLLRDAKGWWESAGTRAKESTPSVGRSWAEGLYAARFRDDVRAGRRSYDAQRGIDLSGDPTKRRKLLEPRVIRERILQARRNPSSNPEFGSVARRIENEANAQVLSAEDAILEEEFLRILDAELAEGVRYVDETTNAVMTNRYLDEVILNSDTAGSVFKQMDDINARHGGPLGSGKKGQPIRFSDNAKSVLPRYVALMKANIRTRSLMDMAANDAVAIPGSKVAQGDVSRWAQKASDAYKLSQADLDVAHVKLAGLGMDEGEVADIIAQFMRDEGISAEQFAEFVRTPQGELYGTAAELQSEVDALFEVLEAASKGRFYSELSERAQELLTGGNKVDNWEGLSISKRNELLRKRLNRTEALAAVEEATKYIADLTTFLGKIEAQRNALGAVVQQIAKGSPTTQRALRSTLDKLARDLSEAELMIDDLVVHLQDAYRNGDPTVVAAEGLRAMGDPASIKAAQAELRATARELSRTAEGLGELRRYLKDIPEDGKFVRLTWGPSTPSGRQKSWRIRFGVQPLRQRPRAPRRDTLSSLLGRSRAEGLRKVLATLDDSPASVAQAAVLENYVNIMKLQERVGNLIPGAEMADTLEAAFGDIEQIRRIVAEAAETDYTVALDAAFDSAVQAGRRSPTMKRVLDPLASQYEEYQTVLREAAESVVKIQRQVQDAAQRRALYHAEVQRAQGELAQAAESAWLPDKLRAASSAEEAARIIREGQNVEVLADLAGQSLPEFVTSMMRSYSPDFFADDLASPTVSNLTKSKLRGTSFVAPLGKNLSDKQVADLALSYAEMFQSAARTFDPREMNSFFLKMERFNNWWKAQAVGTPGFVMRNMMGAVWMNNQLAQVPFSTMGRVVVIRRKAAEVAAKAGRQGDIRYGLDELVRQAREGKKVKVKGGAFTGKSDVPLRELEIFSDWYSSGIASGTGGRGIEIVSAVDSGGQVLETRGFRSGFAAGTLKPSADFKFFSAIRGWNADVEFMARGSLAHHVMMMDGQIEDAADLVRKYHFDYSDLTAQERELKQIIPFWTWQRRALPVLIESVARNPKAWNRISQFQANIEQHSPQEGVVPGYFGENMGIRLPFKLNGFRAYTLPDLPFTDLADWAKSIPTGQDGEPFDITDLPVNLLRKPLESTIPSYKFPVEMLMGTRTFNQVPFSDELQFAPSWANIPVMREALLMAGLAEQSASGKLLMTDVDIYKTEQFVPFFARISRTVPNIDPAWESSDTTKQITTILNTVFGLGLRVNTPREQRNEMLRQMYQGSAEQNRLEMLAR